MATTGPRWKVMDNLGLMTDHFWASHVRNLSCERQHFMWKECNWAQSLQSILQVPEVPKVLCVVQSEQTRQTSRSHWCVCVCVQLKLCTTDLSPEDSDNTSSFSAPLYELCWFSLLSFLCVSLVSPPSICVCLPMNSKPKDVSASFYILVCDSCKIPFEPNDYWNEKEITQQICYKGPFYLYVNAAYRREKSIYFSNLIKIFISSDDCKGGW